MDNENVVNEELTTPTPTEGEAVEDTPEEVTTPAGSKTDSELLLKSLRDERAKRTLLEQELEAEKLKNSSNAYDPELFTDEGKALHEEIASIKSTLYKEIDTLKGELSKKDVLILHPILKDKWTEFDEFRLDQENKGMNLRTAAKAFLIEKGLMDIPRKGLEKTTGGQRNTQPTKMTSDDIKLLRTTNFRKYTEMLSKGLLKIDDK